MNVTLVVKKGSNETKVVRLRSAETVIGRQNGCELRIPSAAVSRRHCRLTFNDDVLSVEDLDSANGTLVNGERIDGMQVLRPGDSLEVGPIVFKVKYELTPEAEERLAQEDDTAGDGFEIADEVSEVDVQELEVEEVTEIDEEAPRAKKSKKSDREDDGDTRHEETKTDRPAEEKKPPKSPAAKKKAEKPGKRATRPPQESMDPDVAAMLDGDASWQMPAGDDFRDFLNQMEDQ